MNRLTRWDPLRELEEMQRRWSEFFDVQHLGGGSHGTEDEHIGLPEWSPLVDITEDDKEYLIKVELPEVRKDDVTVTVENGMLKISGERRSERPEKGRKFHRMERFYGRFERQFGVPEDATAANVKASFKDGILQVRLVKNEISHKKAIPVTVG